MKSVRRVEAERGITLLEIMIVVVIVGVMATIAVPGFRNMQEDQRVRSAARDIADSFQLARANAIRSGANHIVVLQGATGAPVPTNLRTNNIIDVVNDGVTSSGNCTIDGGDVIHSVAPSGQALSWGTTTSLAGNTSVPSDPGFAPSNTSHGSSFTDATVTTTTSSSSKFASWVVFQPDGIPRLMTPSDCANVSAAGRGGGAIYLTNGRRDYAVVLSAFGAVRVHHWIPGGGWSE